MRGLCYSVGVPKSGTGERKKMAKITNAKAWEYIADRIPFEGNLSAVLRSDGEYEIYSYATKIARADREGEIVYLDNRRFSVTTTKHQSIINKGLSETPMSIFAQIIERA
jgi:hypothetical protein